MTDSSQDLAACCAVIGEESKTLPPTIAGADYSCSASFLMAGFDSIRASASR